MSVILCFCVAPCDGGPGLCLQYMEWQPAGHEPLLAWEDASDSSKVIPLYVLQASTYPFLLRIFIYPVTSPTYGSDPIATLAYHICFFALPFRFGKVEDQKDTLRLYTVQIPHKRDRKPPQCYLSKWDGQNFLPMLTNPCGTEVISTLAVRWGRMERIPRIQLIFPWLPASYFLAPFWTVLENVPPLRPSFPMHFEKARRKIRKDARNWERALFVNIW